MPRRALRYLAPPLALIAGIAGAADFRSTTEAAVLYDAPSVKSKPLYALGRDYPLEVIVDVEGWLKVLDAGGTVAWIQKKAVGAKRVVVVRAVQAEVLASPNPSAPLVFRAEQNVVLDLVDADSAATTPGWVKVRHRDGQVGFVRIQQIWGL